MPRAWLLVTLASLAASLAPLKSFGKTKGRGIRIQDKKGNKNEAVVELFLGTAELETATVGGFTRSQKCVKVDGCAIYGEMNDQDVTRFSGCLGVICPFAAITVARDATDTRKLADALEAARRGAYAVGAEKVSGDAKEGPMGGAYKTLEKARGAVGIFGLDENVAAPKNPLEGLKAPELANPLRDWNPAPRAPAAAPAPLAAAAAAAQAAAEKGEAELAAIKDGGSSSWNPSRSARLSMSTSARSRTSGRSRSSRRGRSRRPRRAGRPKPSRRPEAAAARDSAIAAATAARDSAIAAARARRGRGRRRGRARGDRGGRGRARARPRPNKKPKPRRPRRAPNATGRRRSSTRRRLRIATNCRRACAPAAPPRTCSARRRTNAGGKWPRSVTGEHARRGPLAPRGVVRGEPRRRARAHRAAAAVRGRAVRVRKDANRKAGKSDADYWAARKAEEAPEEEDDDDF